MKTMTSAIPKKRFTEIDLLRFFAAFFVVMFHYTFRGFAADNLCVVSYPSWGQFFKYGYLGVDLFFIISGFVILLSAHNKTAKEFLVSRIVRLYPAYWICLIITTIAILCFDKTILITMNQFFANLTMFQTYLGESHVSGVYWSLIVEVKFYLLIFLLLLFNLLKYLKYFLGLWIILILTTSLVHLPGVDTILFPDSAHYFIAGATFYLIFLEGFSAYKIVLLAVSFYLSIQYAIVKIIELEQHYQHFFQISLVMGIILFFYLMFFLISWNKRELFHHKTFIAIGALTYPLYLIHENIGYILLNNMASFLNKYLLLIIVLSSSVFLAFLINQYIEKKFSPHLKIMLNQLFFGKTWLTKRVIRTSDV